MGILWDDYDNKLDESTAAYLGGPKEQSAPMFAIRPSRQSRCSRRSKWRSLPLYLPSSGLSHDADIARLTSPISHNPAIQHREISTNVSNTTDIPQSLPPPSALSSSSRSTHLLNNTNSIPINLDLTPGDWTFINTPSSPNSTTPLSEPETWILLSDDS